jgi:hypothetical protein
LPEPKLSEPGNGFLTALAEAARTAGGELSRQAVRCVLLRGGEVIATDGRQLLVQKGFSFPWDGEALIPALPAFGCKELAGHKTLIGKHAGKIVLSCGPWSLCMDCEDARHFPDVSRVMAGGRPSSLFIDHADAATLLKGLPSMPGNDETHAPVTLHLGARPRVSAGTEEVALSRSKAFGPALAVPTDRAYLTRALSLGFREVSAAADRPLMCRDERRVYLWMPLDGSGPAPRPRARPPAGQPERRDESMPTHDAGVNGAPPEPAALEEAEALKAQLQEALVRTSRLVAALKRRRREERAVNDVVASLKKISGLGG